MNPTESSAVQSKLGLAQDMVLNIEKLCGFCLSVVLGFGGVCLCAVIFGLFACFQGS